jgi:hypothetical protein
MRAWHSRGLTRAVGLSLLGAGLLALVVAVAGQDGPAAHGPHWQAARVLAQGDAAMLAAFERGCSPAAAPATAAQALQRLQAAEAEHRAERVQLQPREERLRLAVVQRACAAHHASHLQPDLQIPIWLHTRLQLTRITPGQAGFEVEAQASTPLGPVARSRITLARGLHHSCFGLTDNAGVVRCTLLDTHPHGNRLDGWAEAHEGPFVATLAGSVSPTVVELPAFAARAMPVFSASPFLR